MMATSPNVAARRMRVSCVLNNGRFCSVSRRLRSPSTDVAPLGVSRLRELANLSAPRSSVRITTSWPAKAFTTRL